MALPRRLATERHQSDPILALPHHLLFFLLIEGGDRGDGGEEIDPGEVEEKGGVLHGEGARGLAIKAEL